MTKPPDFVILGTQKSASTFVQACLSEHPGLYLASGEIPLFETPDYESGAAERLTGLLEGHGESLVGFKRPNSLAKPEVPARLAEHMPDVRFIVVLRDPVSRSISAYYHYMKYGFIPVLDVETGMRRILSGDYDARHPAAKDILDYGFYHRHLSRYLGHFARDRFSIVLHEDIVEDKVAQIQALYRWLGVDAGYRPKALNSRPQAVVYSLPRLRFLTQRNRFLFRYDAARTRQSSKSSLAGKVIARGIDVADKILLSHVWPSRKPALSPDLERRLRTLYAEDIAALERLLNRDLSTWREPRAASSPPHVGSVEVAALS